MRKSTPRHLEENASPEEPLVLSQMGNPFPKGLAPAHVKYRELSEWKSGESTGHSILREAHFPVDPARARPADPYIYETFGPNDPDPPLRHHRRPREDRQNDKQYEADCRFWEGHLKVMGLYHTLCQRLCSFLGNHKTCKVGACRRKQRCVSRRDESRFGVPYVIFPPCVPLDAELIHAYRLEIGNGLRRWKASCDAREAADPGARRAEDCL